MRKYILGLESSCDETAAAIVSDQKEILGHAVLSQLAEHRPYGGVVPEIAARSHLVHIEDIVKQALDEAGLSLSQIDAVAATGGPGLIGGVIVGVMTAKAYAMGLQKPFIAVNHLEGHALTPRLSDDIPFPYLLLLVSGGHCQLVIVRDVGDYQVLGATLDDAAGEAYDKSAKLMGLGYPGGPALEKMAKTGDPRRFQLPIPMKGKPNYDFSFSGLKTAVRQTLIKLGAAQNQQIQSQDLADLAASFQYSVAESLADRCRRAARYFRETHPEGQYMVVAGGVAANQYLRARLQQVAADHDLSWSAPPLSLCTDNGAMIAWAGMERWQRGQADSLDFAPRPRWPLQDMTKPGQ